MQLTLIGSADAAGVPVPGCACTLCRQARAVRHLRRRPTCLSLQEGNEQVLIEAGSTDFARSDWLEPPSAVLLSSWEPPHWSGMVRLHLGKGTELPVFGPRQAASAEWLRRTPGRLSIQAVLEPDRETLVGRFYVRPFTISADAGLLAYGIGCGSQRLAYIPVTESIAPEHAQQIAQWHPQAVVLGCPAQGRPDERLAHVVALYELLGHPTLLLTGIDHHLDQWLTHYAAPLPDGIRPGHDDQRLDMAYLNEYRRLGELAN
jgi:phosphoribosyl 1,2-cyclic phosphate phosphodiesterase